MRQIEEFATLYEGPQTPEALIAEFDQRLLSGYNETACWTEKTTMDANMGIHDQFL